LGSNCSKVLEEAQIDAHLRPQALQIEEWCKLGQAFQNYMKQDPEVASMFHRNALKRELDILFTEEELEARKTKTKIKQKPKPKQKEKK